MTRPHPPTHRSRSDRSRHPRRRLAATACAVALATAGLGMVPAAADPPSLRVGNDQTVFLRGAVDIDVETSAAGVAWTLRDAEGAVSRTGTSTAADGRAVIDLDTSGVGYYTLEVRTQSAEVATLTGSLAVLDPLPASQRGSAIGVGTHFVGLYKRAQISTIDRVGFGTVRAQVPWNQVETTRGQYTFPEGLDFGVAGVKAAGARPLLLVGKENKLYADEKTPTTPADLAAFGRYANAVVEHYGPDAVDLEIYNEYMYANSGACGVTPACFQTMIDAVADAVHAEHPQVPLSASGVQSGTSNTVDLTSLDATITHQYVYPNAPEAALPGRLQTFHDIIRSRPGGDLPLWLTEYGWPTHTPGGNVEGDQADYAIRGGVFALATGQERIYWYDLVDDGYDRSQREQNFGLMRLPRAGGFSGITPKPSLVAQATLVRQLAGKDYVARSATNPTTYAYRFGAGTVSTRVLWSTAGESVDVHTSGSLTVVDRFGRSRIVSPTNGRVRIALTGHPQFVTGAITGVTQA